MHDAAQRLSFLAAELARHNRLYHDADAPEISDTDYDALARENAPLEATHPQPARRGAWQFALADCQSARRRGHRTGVRALGDTDRREEIARMLSGAEVTDKARAEAVKLLED